MPFSSFSGVTSSFADAARSVMRTEKERENFKNVSKACTIAKVITVAAAIAMVALSALAIFSGAPFLIAFGILSGGAVLAALHDFYRLFSNMQEIADDPITEVRARFSRETLKNQLSKGMIFAKPIVKEVIDRADRKGKSTYFS